MGESLPERLFFGVTVHSQLMKAGRVIDLRAERILIIGNKTVFHEYIQSLSRIGNLLEKKIIVVYLGGFPGPDKRFFLRQIQDKFDKNGLQIEVQFWGDIDWEGSKYSGICKNQCFHNYDPIVWIRLLSISIWIGQKPSLQIIKSNWSSYWKTRIIPSFTD